MWITVAEAVRFVAQCQHAVRLNLRTTIIKVRELFYFTFLNVCNLGLDRDTYTKFIVK